MSEFTGSDGFFTQYNAPSQGIPHTCREFDPACFRCDLSRDEAQAIARRRRPSWADED